MCNITQKMAAQECSVILNPDIDKAELGLDNGLLLIRMQRALGP